MTDLGKIALNLRRFREAVANHDRVNPDHDAWGIGLSPHDMGRLGFEEGEQLWPGIVVRMMNVAPGRLRVLCDGSESEGDGEAVATVEAVSRQMVGV